MTEPRDIEKDKAMCERDWRYSADTKMALYYITQYEAALQLLEYDKTAMQEQDAALEAAQARIAELLKQLEVQDRVNVGLQARIAELEHQLQSQNRKSHGEMLREAFNTLEEQEENRPRFKMDANGNLTRVEDNP